MAVTSQGAPPRGALIPFKIRLPQSRGLALALFIGKRILWLIPIVFFVILITFSLMHNAPGSPWDRGGGRELSAATRRLLDQKYGLDQPVWHQFLLYLWNVAHLDFGDSYQYKDVSVMSILIGRWPVTATLGLLAFIIIVVFGIGLGVLAALRQNTWVDYATMGFATFGASVPNFVVGIGFVLLFSVLMYSWTQGQFFLPTSGFGLDDHLIMPVATLALLPTAFIARLTRSSTLETLRQDYVRTAWAKGLRERLVVFKHILKNSLIPVVTALGPTFAFLITGSVIVETVFGISGIGNTFVQAVSSRDYPMILATSVQFAVVVAVANLVVDVMYVFIDPRVRLS